MKKLFFIIFCVFFTQKIFSQVAQYDKLYLLFEPDPTQANSIQTKSNNMPVEINGTWRNEDGYGYSSKTTSNTPEYVHGFYGMVFTTIDRTQFITIPLSQLSNYPVRTIEQVFTEAHHASNHFLFTNWKYFTPIQEYYIVEKNVSTGTAKIIKVNVDFGEERYFPED